MNLLTRAVLLSAIFFALLNGIAVAQSTYEVERRVQTAPRRDVGNNVIDGTGKEVGSDGSVGSLPESGQRNRIPISTVAWLTLAMAAATGLGAVPFFFVELQQQWAGICNGLAAGVMLAASFDLVQEGQDNGSGNWVVVGILTGGVFIWLCKQVRS